MIAQLDHNKNAFIPINLTLNIQTIYILQPSGFLMEITRSWSGGGVEVVCVVSIHKAGDKPWGGSGGLRLGGLRQGFGVCCGV